VARYRPKGIGLERVLGTKALASTAYGDVGSSIYYALGLVAIFALGMTPVVFLIAGVFFVMTAMTYAEATANFPEAGGASSFARRAFNELASFFAGWAQILNYVITVSISAFFVPHYLSVFWPALAHGPGDVLGGIVIVIALTTLNIVGVRESARVNFVLAAIDYATQLLLVSLGVFLVLDFSTIIHNIHLGVAPHWSQLAVSIPVAMISYTGLETISNMSEESRSPRTLVPRAYKVLVVAVLSIYALLPAIALSALPVTQQPDGSYSTQLATKYAGDPILGIIQNMSLGALEGPLKIYVGILAATILIVAANAGTIGVSRLTYSLGRHQQLPERLRHISPRSRTPVVALAVFCVLACLAMVPGKETFLGNMYAFGAMLSFTTAHVSLIGLRWRLARNRMRKLPGDVEVGEGEGWVQAPFNLNFAGVSVPLFAVFGGLLTGTAWVTVMALHRDVFIAGMGWLVLGLSTYVLYRRSKGLSLTGTHLVQLPAPAGVAPVSYAGVLVAFEEGTYSDDAMAVALKLAAHRRSDVRVVVTIEVPSQLAIDAPLPEAEVNAGLVIETARQWAARGQRVRGQVEKVRVGEAGHRIVQIAQRLHADAIVMPMPHRKPPGRLLSPTLSTVLAKRPARVIIDSTPATPIRPRGALDGRPAREEPVPTPA
jgi:APA family basic amino acid/polyamine antiporter